MQISKLSWLICGS